MKLFAICTLLLLLPLETIPEKIECKNVACPKPECPADSHPKLKKKHHSVLYAPRHLHSGTGDVVRKKRAIAYDEQQRESIKIIPGVHNRKRSITEDEMLVQQCCPPYECVCKPNYCDQECPPNMIPSNTTSPTEYSEIQYGVPGNCCFPCKNNYCLHPKYKFRRHAEKWHPDDCTTCECLYGDVNCQTTFCKPPNCIHHKRVPGECCDVCDNDATNFCNHVGNCDIHCKYGYLRQGSCDLCECVKFNRNHTTTEPDSIAPIGKNNTKESPHQHKVDSNSFYNIKWIALLLNGFVVLVLIVFGVWCCHFRKSAKYSTVQIS